MEGRAKTLPPDADRPIPRATWGALSQRRSRGGPAGTATRKEWSTTLGARRRTWGESRQDRQFLRPIRTRRPSAPLSRRSDHPKSALAAHDGRSRMPVRATEERDHEGWRDRFGRGGPDIGCGFRETRPRGRDRHARAGETQGMGGKARRNQGQVLHRSRRVRRCRGAGGRGPGGARSVETDRTQGAPRQDGDRRLQSDRRRTARRGRSELLCRAERVR